MELMEFITDKDEATWEASVLDFMRMRDFSCRSGSPWGMGDGGWGGECSGVEQSIYQLDSRSCGNEGYWNALGSQAEIQ